MRAKIRKGSTFDTFDAEHFVQVSDVEVLLMFLKEKETDGLSVSLTADEAELLGNLLLDRARTCREQS